MNTKYVLVDEAKYNALLKHSIIPSQQLDSEHLNIAKSDMDHVLYNPFMNESAKNVLYNDALRKYLKKFNYIRNKPLDVKLSDESIEKLGYNRFSELLKQLTAQNNSPQPSSLQRQVPSEPSDHNPSRSPSPTFSFLSNFDRFGNNSANPSRTPSPAGSTLSQVLTPKPFLDTPLKKWETRNLQPKPEHFDDSSEHMLSTPSNESKLFQKNKKETGDSDQEDVVKKFVSGLKRKAKKETDKDSSDVKRKYTVNEW